jgi:hypothetical protein
MGCGMRRYKGESHEQHEQRESIGDEFAEHSGQVGTRTPDQRFKAHVFGRDR